MAKILLFTLGSVQDYILESRRVIDLVNSSKIISELMKTIKDKSGCELLLPNVEKNQNSFNSTLPNYLIFSYDSPESRGREIEKYIHDEYIKEYLMKRIGLEKYNLSKKLQEQIKEHISSIFDIYWVETEVNDEVWDDEEKYKELYEDLYKNLEAVKYVKKFSGNKEQGRKCSICGKRNAIFYRRKDEEKKRPFDIQKDSKEIKDNTFQNIIFKKGECLCGACYMKRVLGNDKNKNKEKDIEIKSTAAIALSNWKKINQEKYPEEYKEYRKMIEDRYSQDSKYGEEQLLYKEKLLNVNRKILEDGVSEQLQTDKDRVEKLFAEVFKGKQEEYYSIYRADIDDLGKWMSGEYKSDNAMGLLEYQQQLSNKIDGFLKEVRKFFNENKDCLLVYAGGDDILALLPVRKSIELAEKVYDCFNKKVKNEEVFKEITLSQGIFILHYKDTLSESLQVSKERIDYLKKKYKNISRNGEKNGFIIAVLTEGYSYQEFYAKNILNDDYIVEILKELYTYFAEKSSHFYRELSEIFLSMDSNDLYLEQKRDLIEMFLIQQKRLLKRSLKEKEKEENKEALEKTEKLLKMLLQNNNYEYGSAGLKNYLNLFYIIDKISVILRDDKQNENAKN
ncbi:type III-B CRISPR-associated protein Cas10/Cmr2 [Iocasia frigidifontis]|uniref:Type III-B CRISPR-associated protein Cas10/Cmr2 n=1 Tax=Iocasia fonsfrigidae TaxID=2682810 RepID=A0A8A7KF09_9FIRM|nr:type III-B CRISPR-associated protein Cas10/Cmr2 [Iocasia fonsfrigidae]QTL97487.1 type III-B CRISPR-associated protein Cas10/Cmr2 [Iocasia fonsfrigidae]